MSVNETLNSKTVAELRKLAASYGIAGRSTMKKAELIDRLIAAGVELSLSLDEITPEQEARFAEQVKAAKAKTDVVSDADPVETPSIFEDAPPVRTYSDGSQTYGPYVTADNEAAYIEDGLKADDHAGTYSFVNEVAVLRHAPGRALVTAAFDGRTVGGSIFRKGKRLVLVAGLITITGKSYEQVAKRFAKRLGFHADAIDVARAI